MFQIYCNGGNYLHILQWTHRNEMHEKNNIFLMVLDRIIMELVSNQTIQASYNNKVWWAFLFSLTPFMRRNANVTQGTFEIQLYLIMLGDKWLHYEMVHPCTLMIAFSIVLLTLWCRLACMSSLTVYIYIWKNPKRHLVC